MSQKKRRQARKAAPSLPKALATGLHEAGDLMRRQHWAEAREVLEDLDDQFPQRPEVVAALAETCRQLGEGPGLLAATRRLNELLPRKAEPTLLLAQSYLMNGMIFLARQAFQSFLERWPDHPRVAEIRRLADQVEAQVEQVQRDEGLSGDEGREIARLQEEMRVEVEAGEYALGRRAAERLLQLWPGFAPALNNLGEIHFREGRLDQALATPEQVLQAHPDNVHALSNLTRYLFLAGRSAEAREAAGRLKALTSAAPDLWLKKAEALAYLGDDAGVLDALRGAEQAGEGGRHPRNALLYHLAAVAAWRQGREKEAREHWRTARECQPGFSLVRDNLEDLRRPPEEWNAPWPFSFGNWVPERVVASLLRHIQPAARKKDDEAFRQEMARYLNSHPEVAALVPPLLDRGDPSGRLFAFQLALFAGTPEMSAALRDFALGQRGPDQLRMEAAQAAVRAGLLSAGKLRMWLAGEWREVQMFGFELTDEPVNPDPAPVLPLTQEAHEALLEGDAVRAEKLLKKALQIGPETPSMLNNLALAYQFQGRLEEREALLKQLFERYPDYLFARAHRAAKLASEGKTREAHALLEPFLSRPRLHYSEFAALCAAEVQIALKENNAEAARSWLSLWEQGYPDHPNLEILYERAQERGWVPARRGQRR